MKFDGRYGYMELSQILCITQFRCIFCLIKKCEIIRLKSWLTPIYIVTLALCCLICLEWIGEAMLLKLDLCRAVDLYCMTILIGPSSWIEISLSTILPLWLMVLGQQFFARNIQIHMINSLILFEFHMINLIYLDYFTFYK